MDFDIDDDAIRRVRAAADIVEIIGEHTALAKKGKRWTGLCPFHAEKTPSFSVDRELGLYHCYGCQVGGDVLKFVRERQGLSFPEAVGALAQRYGIELPQRRERVPGADRRRAALHDALERAAELYRAAATPGSRAGTYLKERDVQPETAEMLRLGYAEDRWDQVASALRQVFPDDVLVEAGLCVTGKADKPYDRFRDRLMFPIQDLGGKVVGFSGRLLGKEEGPKYLNSPETPLFHKGRVLYALNVARDSIRRDALALLCEGQFDVLRLHQAGFGNAVAALGTALTAEHVDLLRRYTPAVALCYDGDEAGRRATLKAALLLLAKGLQLSVIEMPIGSDPDSLIQEQGRSAFQERLQNRREFFAWLFESALPPGGGLSESERHARITGLVPYLDAIPDRLLRYGLADRLASMAAVPTGLIWERLQRGNEPITGMPAPRQTVSASEPRGSAGERRVVQIVLEGGRFPDGLRPEDFDNAELGTLWGKFDRQKNADNSLDFQQLMTHLSAREVELLAELAHHDSDGGPPPREGELGELLVQMHRQSLRRRQAQVQARIQAAQKEGKSEEVELLLREKLDLTRALAGTPRIPPNGRDQ